MVNGRGGGGGSFFLVLVTETVGDCVLLGGSQTYCSVLLLPVSVMSVLSVVVSSSVSVLASSNKTRMQLLLWNSREANQWESCVRSVRECSVSQTSFFQ